MKVLKRDPLTTALAEWYQTHAERPVGRRQPPPNRPFPYAVLYSVPGGGFSGPSLAGPDADAAVVYQLNAVALRDDEADQLLDKLREITLDRGPAGVFTHAAPTLDGWKIIDRTPDFGAGDVSYSGAPPKRLFTASERFVFHVTPD